MEGNKKMSVLHKLRQFIFKTVTIILTVSIVLGFAVGIIFKGITGYDNYLFIALICTVSNVVMSILLFLAFSNTIKKQAGEFSNLLQSFGQGEVNIQFDEAASKNKAFAKISEHMKSITDEMRSLVEGTYTLTKSMLQSSFDMTAKVKEASASIHEVSDSIEEMASGASEQAVETENSVTVLTELAKQIASVSDSYQTIIQETTTVNRLNKEGLSTVHVLRTKSDDYNESSVKIFNAVENLTTTLNDIGLFVNTIKDIAEQTNLLALNAAIEAARAGEYGKGFAVVADEVRKLADESKSSTEKIGNLMIHIEKDSHEAIAAMNSMKIVSEQQSTAVNQTETSFEHIAGAIDSITAKINETNETIRQMENGKDKSIASIETTARISSEMATASEEFAATFESQLQVFEELEIAAEQLKDLSNDMEKRLEKYRLH